MDPVTPFNFEPHRLPTQISNIRNHDGEIMQWHITLNHVPFSKLELMSSMGMIPKKPSKIAKYNIPLCASCLYGRATRRPCKNKQDHKPTKPAHIPGEYVSVDSFESSTKGIIR